MAKETKISDLIINAMVKAYSIGETFFDFTYHPYRYMYKSLFEEAGIKEVSIRSALTRLERRGVLERKINKDGEILIKLSDRGKLIWLKKKLISKDIDNLKDRFVLVIFDVPEESKAVRNALRNNLRVFGFEPWQKSVWAIRKDVFNLVSRYFRLAGLLDYVIILETKRVNRH